MNGAIRESGGPQTAGGLHLGARVPPLVARLRGPELDHLATLLSSDHPGQIAELGRSFYQNRQALIRQRDDFQAQLQEAKHTAQKEAVVRSYLESTVGPQKKKDLKALKRWMDDEAILERMAHQIDQIGVFLELTARLLGGLDLNPPAVRFLEQLLTDPRLSTRRESARTIAEWCIACQSTGAMDTQLADRLLSIATRPGEDTLTARHLLLLVSVVGESGDEILEKLLPSPPTRSFSNNILRSQLVKAAFLGGADRREHAWNTARLDPSDYVRSSLAIALKTEGSRLSLDRLRSLAKSDAASSVRARSQQLLDDLQSTPMDDPFEPKPEMQALVSELAQLAAGSSQTVPLPEGSNPLDLAVCLLSTASQDFGYALGPAANGGVHVTRGERKVLRMWRMLYEFRNPKPGKRLLGDHLTGRTHAGPIRVSSGVLAEQNTTGIPNQPRVAGPSSDACPWLPVPEQFLEAADWGSVLIVSGEGITTLHAPQGTFRRLWSQLRLSLRMTRLDQARENAIHSKVPGQRRNYVEQLEHLGFRAEFDPHEENQTPLPGIEQYFSVGTPALVGVAANTPQDLALVATGIGAYSLARLALKHKKLERSRQAIPLRIGNWGTRGKSSIARLEAALFAGLGYSVVCKTTGTEASLLYSPGGESGTRLLNYRPLDKVSIHEHAQALELGCALGAQVFVWECMALRPEYVSQLQELWTQDHLSVITNAHADHEDVQGPTGRDVAEVISEFIPENALTLTAEKEMLPILKQSATARGTELIAVSAKAIQSVPNDWLDHISHQEHPANLALLAELAENLGVEFDEATYLVGQHVEADLGALRVTPPMRHLGRTLRVTNGMAANQPTGLLNNWRRCGFLDADPAGKPHDFYISLVNNRQDRPNRTAAFARAIVRDLDAHRHLLMGSGASGLHRRIEEELEIYMSEWSFPDGPRAVEQRIKALRRRICLTSPGPLLRATATALGLRGSQIATLTEQLDNAIAQAPLGPLSLDEAYSQSAEFDSAIEKVAEQIEGSLFHSSPERRQAIVDAQSHWRQIIAEAICFSAMAKACHASIDPKERLELIKHTYRELFLAHIQVIKEQPTADEIFAAIARSGPPGSHIRAMAIQNIQGPGLDLARRLQAAQTRLALCEAIDSDDPHKRTRAFQALREEGGWSIPLCDELLRAIYSATPDPRIKRERDLTVSHLQLMRGKCQKNLLQQTRFGGAQQHWSSFIEGLLQPLFAVSRRRKADKIIDDLVQKRISRSQAGQQLARIVSDDAKAEKSIDESLVS